MDSRSSGLPPLWTVLSTCQGNLGQSCQLLDSSLVTLRRAVGDFDRLERVLASRRCYELVGEAEVRSAQYQIASEIDPPIKELISKAEAGIERLGKRQKILTDQTMAGTRNQENVESSEKRLQELRQTKERLQSELKRLEMDIAADTGTRL